MAIAYKIVAKKNPTDPESGVKYYPRLVTMGNTKTLEDIIYDIKEMSSLSEGDIRSVLANFTECMRRALYNSQSVNIDGFGVFSLSARSKGAESPKEVQTANIRAVRINFRASSAIRPNLDSATTRQEDRIDFVDLESQLKRLNMTEGTEEEPDEGGGEDTGGGMG